MSVQKRGQEHIRKLSAMGKTSLGLTLPILIVKHLDLRKGQKVSVYATSESIIIVK